MQYNVASILKLSPGNVRSYALDAGQQVPLDDELTLLVESGNVRFSRTNRGLLARGAVHGRVDRLTCSRCLSDMAITLDVPFEDEYLPSIDINHGTPLPAPDDELAFTIDESHHLDLSEAVRQNTLAALPISPICEPDCAGLCPQCGADLNEKPCDCATDGENRPFADLTQWLQASGQRE